MSIIGLLIAVFATVVLVWLVREGRIPQPFQWLVWALLIILWLWVLLMALGVDLHVPLGYRMAD